MPNASIEQHYPGLSEIKGSSRSKVSNLKEPHNRLRPPALEKTGEIGKCRASGTR